MDKSWSSDSIQLLHEIDRKMSMIESKLQQIFGYLTTEDIHEMHGRILEVSQLLLILEQNAKMKSLAKGLSLQLQSIQEQYNQLFGKGEKQHEITE